MKAKHLILIAIPAIFWLYFNQAANWHYHVSDRGIVIEHAHPFKKTQTPGTQFPNHKHTDLEYSILAQISQLGFTGLLIISLAILIRQLVQVIQYSYKSISLPLLFGKSICLRAPPATADLLIS